MPTFTFVGMVSSANVTAQAVATTRGFAQSDLANPPAPNSEQVGGTLVITGAGDYGNVEGPELLRKLTIRRLTTRTGGFAHLPTYGIGFREKEPMGTGSLAQIKLEIARQIAEEPEIDAVDVTLTEDPSTGTTFVAIRERLKKTGQEIVVNYPAAPAVSF